MTTDDKRFPAICPACGSGLYMPLEYIPLKEQHYLYAPDSASTSNDLTRLANIPGNEYQMVKCSRCGLEFSDPFSAPGDEWYRLVYKNLRLYPTERWEFSYVNHQLSRQETIGEIGCGSGEYLKLCRDAGIQAAGFDFSRDAIEACEAAGLNAKLIDVSNAVSELIEANRHSTIVAFQVLEHFDNPVSLFALASKWSSPDASLWVAVPSNRRPSRIFNEQDFLDQPPHHLTRWTEESLRIIGEQNGWKLTCVLYEPINLPTRVWWIATRTLIYKAFAASLFLKIRFLEKVVRTLIYPWALIHSRKIGDSMSGQTMMAQYTRV